MMLQGKQCVFPHQMRPGQLIVTQFEPQGAVKRVDMVCDLTEVERGRWNIRLRGGGLITCVGDERFPLA